MRQLALYNQLINSHLWLTCREKSERFDPLKIRIQLFSVFCFCWTVFGPIINTVILNQQTSSSVKFIVYFFLRKLFTTRINDINDKRKKKQNKKINKTSSNNKRTKETHTHTQRWTSKCVQRLFSSSLWCRVRLQKKKGSIIYCLIDHTSASVCTNSKPSTFCTLSQTSLFFFLSLYSLSISVSHSLVLQ